MNCSHKGDGKRVYGHDFNPYEIAVCGPSSADRIALTTRLASLFDADFAVGQVIQRNSANDDDPHAALGVNLLTGGGEHGLLYPSLMDAYLGARPLMDVDLVFFASEPDVDTPKVVWVGDGPAPGYSNVIAYVSKAGACPILPADAPYFTEDQSLLIRAQLEQHLLSVAESVPLHGLVLVGGRSSRMQEDKGILQYHGLSQVDYCRNLLAVVCDEVFVSLRTEQASEPGYQGLPQIQDAFLGFGPLGGILSAQKANPRAAWLVLACDLPYVSRSTIEYLVANRNPFKLATAYTSVHDGFPEPLCAVYEPKSIFRLTQFLALGYHCPRKVLINSDTCLLEQPDPRSLDNVNDPTERELALNALSREAPRPV